MDLNHFKQKLSKIKVATSVQEKKYNSIRVIGNDIKFVRDTKTKSEKISINELFNLFINKNGINTSIAKSYISGRVQSPAVAILNELKSKATNNITKNIIDDIQEKPIKENKSQKQPNDKIKDETIFFIALSELIGKDYLLSKSIGKPINSSHIFLTNNFKDYNFGKETNDCYSEVLTSLKSNKLFSSDSLSHYVDGLIIKHPVIESRIVEFDEEQHFTPARKDTLKYLTNILSDNYFTTFKDICDNINYLNEFVLKKHRIKNKLKNIPKSFIKFIEWLELSGEKSSRYISSKNGFEFLGGRIAQRAYYDCLRDTAHLSNKNNSLKSPLRFAKKIFEDGTEMKFADIPILKIKEIIKNILDKEYGIRIPSA
jgi:hypothetical protein